MSTLSKQDKAAISHCALAITSIFGLLGVNDRYIGAAPSFMILTANAVVGTLRILGKLFDITTLIHYIFKYVINI